MKKRKRRKNICKYDGKKMNKEYYECLHCGGYESYVCPKCFREYDLDGKEI